MVNEPANEILNASQLEEITIAAENKTLVVDEDGSGVGILKNENTDEKSTPVEEVVNKPVTVTQEFEITSPLEKTDDPDAIGISFPSDTSENIKKTLLAMPNVDDTGTKEGADWSARLSAAQYTVPYKDWFMRTVERPESDWRQMVKSEKGPLMPGGQKFNDPINTKLTGERAVLRVRALTGLGRVISVPLWHSGFWISFKAPSEGALLELNRRISEEKIQLGRLTYGLAYANNSVFYAGWLVDFALAHIYDTSLKTDINTDLRSLISVLDLSTLIWGLASSIWPSGFPYARSIIGGDGKVNKVIKERINPGKMLWPDNASFTPWQIAHMAQRHNNNMTIDSLEKYRNEFTRGKGRSVKLDENISVQFKVPMISEYLVSGMKWVNNIVTMADKAFTDLEDSSARDSYIVDQGKASNMRQFSHFIESIEAGGSTIDETDTIDQVIDALSSSDEIRRNFFIGVKEFIEDATVAVVAITVTEENEVSNLPRFPHLLPIDVMSVFFIQLVQKVSQIQVRT